MSGSIENPVWAIQRNYILVYYNGNQDVTCLIVDLKIEDTAEMLRHINDDMEYEIHAFIQLHSSVLDSNDVTGDGKIYFDPEGGWFNPIESLPCFRFVPKQGEWSEHFVDHMGNVAEDF